jgi:uncharacterized protein (TIGR00369 family)
MHPLDNPFLEWMGVRLTAWADDRAEMRLDVAPRLGNRTGRVQGGVMCTLLDAVAGYAGLHAPPGEVPKQSLTLSLTTNFIAAGDGQVLVAKGFVDRKGRGIYFARSEVWLDDTLLLATAIGTFKYLRAPSGDA